MPTLVLMLTCGLLAGRFHHALGVAPILGAILCAACFLTPRQLFWVALGGIFIRDLWMGVSLFGLFRLLGMGLVVLAIVLLQVRLRPASLITGLVVASPIFHLTLAVGDWATGTCQILPKTPEGLLTALSGAIPYFQRSFIGDLLFSGLFFALYALAAYALLGLREPTKVLLRR